MKPALRAAVELIAPGRVRHVEVPPMDLGLTPNDLLDHSQPVPPPDTGPHPSPSAGSVATHADTGEGLDDVVLRSDGTIVVARVATVELRGADGRYEVHRLPGRVTALAAADEIIAAVEGHGIYTIGGKGPAPLSRVREVRSCVTALAMHPQGGVLVAVGSTRGDLDSWIEDLFERRDTGALSWVASTGEVVCARTGLAWPAGLAASFDGPDMLLSLAHLHRVERIDPSTLERTGTFMANLPAYPWRLTRVAGRRRYWLSLPLVRSRFTEMILEERAFVADMMREVDRDSWYGPSMAGGSIYREPLQLGGLRVLGQLKPWAPPRSYGLIAEVDEQGRVLRSLHSRAAGHVHGVVAAVECGQHVLLAARSCPDLMRFDLDPAGGGL